MRFSILAAIVLLFVSCHKKHKYDGVKLIGHAGSGLQIPTSLYHDNSAEAIGYAVNLQGIDGVEIDIQCSESHTAWLFHDPDLSKQTNGNGCVNSSTDAYLSTLKYKGPGSEELLQLADLDFPFGQKELLLDIRTTNFCTGMLIDQQYVISAIEHAVPEEIVVKVITNAPDWVHAFFLKGWKVYLEVSEPQEYVNGAMLSETVGTCLRSSAVSKEQVSELHGIGKEVIIFDARSAKGVRTALKKFPDYLLVDDLKAALIEKY